MKHHALGLIGPLLVAGLMGCSPSATYYKIAVSPATGLSGTNCPNNTGDQITITGVDGAGTIALYSEPNSQYFLDLGSLGSAVNLTGDVGLTGTASGSNYTFSASWSEVQPGNTEITTTSTVTVDLTTSGSGLTGTIKYEFQCQSSDGMGCGSGNPLPIASTNKQNFDCTDQASIVGAEVSGVQEVTPTSASSGS